MNHPKINLGQINFPKKKLILINIYFIQIQIII